MRTMAIFLEIAEVSSFKGTMRDIAEFKDDFIESAVVNGMTIEQVTQRRM